MIHGILSIPNFLFFYPGGDGLETKGIVRFIYPGADMGIGAVV